MEKNSNKKNNYTKWLILLLLLITILALGITAWALFFRGPSVVLTPDYAPRSWSGMLRP